MEAPVYIASKGRPNGPTMKLLAEAGIRATVFVEPQEVEAYATTAHDIVSINASNQGLAYVRNFCLTHARTNSEKVDWFWLLDDDIKQMGFAENKRVHKADPKAVFERAEALLIGADVGQGGLEYWHTAWSATKDVVGPSYCDVAVLINVDRTLDISFKTNLALKVDRDFTMQVLAKGHKVLRAARCAFQCPAIGTNAGGLQDVYKAKRDADEVNLMVEMWPGVCEPMQKEKRIDLKIHWRKIGHRAGVTALPIHCAHTTTWPLKNFRPNPMNDNTHSDDQISRLAEIMKENGWRAPIVVSSLSNLIVKGHARFAAAQLLGLSDAPVDIQAYDSHEKELQDLVADNRAFEMGETDDEAMKASLAKLNEDLPLAAAGFTQEEFDRAMGRLTATLGAGVTTPAAMVGRNTVVLHYSQEEHDEFRRLEAEHFKGQTTSRAVAQLLGVTK